MYYQGWSFIDQRSNELKATHYVTATAHWVTTASATVSDSRKKYKIRARKDTDNKDTFSAISNCLRLLIPFSVFSVKNPKTSTRTSLRVHFVFWAVGITNFVTSVFSKNHRPRHAFDNFSDRHPNCSWRQGGVAKERADGNPEEEVASQWSNGLQPLLFVSFSSFSFHFLSAWIQIRAAGEWSRIQPGKAWADQTLVVSTYGELSPSGPSGNPGQPEGALRWLHKR